MCEEEMKEIESFWQRLIQVKKMQIKAQCRKIPESFARREGIASVDIESKREDQVVFFERGKWQAVQSQEAMSFTNVFRWTLDTEQKRVKLEHLRFGEKYPVFLFDLMVIEPGLLKSVCPHECKEDIYQGSVLFDAHFVHLEWKITGPKKNECTQMIYV